LLKITADGEIVPALVALEPDPVPSATPPATGAAGATAGTPPPSGGDVPTGDVPTAAPIGGSAGAGGASGAAVLPPAPLRAPAGSMPNPQPQPQQEPLPRVTALGLSPDGSVYVLFEHGFVFRQPTAEESAAPGFDPFSPQSPLRCQLFRADGSWKDNTPGNHELAELECVTNEYQVRPGTPAA
jgi:hypothetical protein